MTLLDKLYHTPETQATVTTGAAVAYVANPENWVFILTMILLVGQVGLLAIKYYKVYKDWKAKKNGLEG